MDLAAKMYQAGREAEGAVLLQEAAVLTRNMSARYRELLMSSGNPDYAARLEQIMAEVHPVQIGFTEQGWFGVRMEPLSRAVRIIPMQKSKWSPIPWRCM